MLGNITVHIFSMMETMFCHFGISSKTDRPYLH